MYTIRSIKEPYCQIIIQTKLFSIPTQGPKSPTSPIGQSGIRTEEINRRWTNNKIRKMSRRPIYKPCGYHSEKRQKRQDSPRLEKTKRRHP